ncbi:heparan sulfate glucosamine 3-O-sulfotransferase 3B1-like isoform X2 [Homarus americanus]|uniref:heparan sulfate glucosamine 3-O-sulfotransferase 3B1-like isoform X2 n=1 Tax=Homarus americanus TaxID=6706 RepID=UPI001C496F10|nr:heparan sulfate glucosamine 3-O-sulfotransferase 3B1-like isoform X2 [Homarus americanus]
MVVVVTKGAAEAYRGRLSRCCCWGGGGMHLPRRLCSLLGGVFVLFFCFFCVADYYGYHYYPRTAIISQEYQTPHLLDDTSRRVPSLTNVLLNDTANSPNWGAAVHGENERRFPKEKKRRQCKKKYWKCNKLPTDPEPPLEMFEELGEAGYNLTLESESMEAPLWSQFTDRGYTFVGTNGSAMRRLPHVLIIGAKKSGTRALLAFLRVHPSIKASGPEIHYFDRFYTRGLSWYSKHRSRRAFEELAFVRSSSGLVNSDWGPISGGLYAKHFSRWLDHFPRSSIHVVSGENLIRDPAAELCRVQEFLGLRRVITDKHFFFNATKGFPCLVKREKAGRPHCLGSSKGRSHPPVSQATYNILRDFYRPFNFKFYKMVGHNFHW